MKGKEKSTLLATAAMPDTRGMPAAWEIALLFGSGVWLLLKDRESRCKSRKFVALRCCCPLAGAGGRHRWQQVALQARRAGGLSSLSWVLGEALSVAFRVSPAGMGRVGLAVHVSLSLLCSTP